MHYGYSSQNTVCKYVLHLILCKSHCCAVCCAMPHLRAHVRGPTRSHHGAHRVSCIELASRSHMRVSRLSNQVMTLLFRYQDLLRALPVTIVTLAVSCFGSFGITSGCAVAHTISEPKALNSSFFFTVSVVTIQVKTPTACERFA